MNEYIDTIDKVLEYLKSEKDRRSNAIKSGEFCDNKTGERHIRILEKGIEAMEEQIEIEKGLAKSNKATLEQQEYFLRGYLHCQAQELSKLKCYEGVELNDIKAELLDNVK